MSIDLIDRHLLKMPLLNRFYARNAAQIKRRYCLFLHHLGLLRPLSFVQWLATYDCNFHCPYCEASAGGAAQGELTTAEVKVLLDDLRRMGVKRLLVSGGEPLVRADLMELLDYANHCGLDLGLVTNGYLVEELWNELKRFRYFLYFTSIDGLPAYNDRVRGKEGAFDHALRGLELFAQMKVPTRMVNTVVHPGNFTQLDGLLDVLLDSAANRWHLTPAAKVGRAGRTDEFSLDGMQLKELVDFIRANRHRMAIDLGESHTYLGCFDGWPVGKPFFCGAGLTRCSIMPDGEVLGCQQVYDRTFTEGNIRQVPFPRLWKEGFRRFRGQVERAACRDCSHLAACQGGCWAEMELHRACLKALWPETDRSP